MEEPIKRAVALQPLSRDNHQALLLCWKSAENSSRDNLETQINRGANPSGEENSNAKKYALSPVEASILILKQWMELRRLSNRD